LAINYETQVLNG